MCEHSIVSCAECAMKDFWRGVETESLSWSEYEKEVRSYLAAHRIGDFAKAAAHQRLWNATHKP